jgi:hypothetical protein
MASLDSVRQKILWAAKHLKSLDAETTMYFDQKPGEVVAETDPDTNRIILRFSEKIPVPPAIPLAIGDALQNLRSALDYLVWELVLASSNNPTKDHMFPICSAPEAFEDQIRRRRLDGVTPQAIAEIRGLQPFHYGKNWEKAPIQVLDTLVNVNKHRRLLLSVLAAHHSRTEFIGTQTGHSVQTTLTPRYDKAEIAIGPAPIVDEEMEVKGKAIFFITFNERPAEGHIISGLLNQLWHFVNEYVVPKFEQSFV